ncbi:DUF547 domain-containing protein [Nonlabens xiamenensis]|uniref:DUF547 domain-containing protein n=1 Tax=Nonlabens xiamenensis TaxID=2341043 RepID=UPI000F60E8A3|nr:DUF547 domain-containing protein [Nonlabens xiamenensis]
MKKYLFILLFLSSLPWSYAQSTADFYKAWDAFLQQHVNDGLVDYAAVAKNPQVLNEIVDHVKELNVSIDQPADYQAFWINAYNLLVIKSLVDAYPIASPLDKKGFFDQTKHQVGGKQITLNDIENKLLRAQFNDPRHHFVLVCGALGCPPLIDRAYTPSMLEKQLDQQTELAINDEQFIRPGKKLMVSQIFEWYATDFEKEGGILAFINTYHQKGFPENTKIKFYPYNWKINQQ